jgi:hypothetical protein
VFVECWSWCFYDYHWVDTSADGIFFPNGIIHTVVIGSALTWFIMTLSVPGEGYSRNASWALSWARQPLYHRCSLILFSLKSFLYVHEMIPLVVYRKLDKNNIFKNLKLSLFLLNWCMELQVKHYNRVHMLR